MARAESAVGTAKEEARLLFYLKHKLVSYFKIFLAVFQVFRRGMPGEGEGRL